MQENAIRTRFQKEFANADTLSGKKAAFKKYITDTPDNLEIRPRNVPYGTFLGLISRLSGVSVIYFLKAAFFPLKVSAFANSF